MTRKFSLRWLDFHTNLNQSIEAFQKSGELVDVTLSAGGRNFHAHKLILSICSPFFRNLFLKNPCENAIVILKEVEHMELYKLLQFIYQGEVHVEQQELKSFLETAEFLQIKGLSSVRERNEVAAAEANDTEETDEPNAPPDSQADCDSQIKETTEAIEPPTVSGSETTQKDSEPSSLKRCIENIPTSDSCSDEKKARPNSDSSKSNDSNKEAEVIGPTVETVCTNEPMTAKGSGLSSKTNTVTSINCVYCNRFFANAFNLKVHIQDKHEPPKGTLRCHKCHKYMRNHSCLRVHMYKHHKPVFRHPGFIP